MGNFFIKNRNKFNMKFVLLASTLIGSTFAAGTAYTWASCYTDADCKTSGDKCCVASNPPAISANLCGPPDVNTVPPPTTTYNGWNFKCKVADAKASYMTLGATAIASSLYMLA